MFFKTTIEMTYIHILSENHLETPIIDQNSNKSPSDTQSKYTEFTMKYRDVKVLYALYRIHIILLNERTLMKVSF